MDFENPMEIEPFQFTLERTDKLQNNLNLLNSLDSRRVLFNGDSYNLEFLNETFRNVDINEKDMESINFEDYRSILKFCQASVELYNYLQTNQNAQILEKYQQYQTLTSIKKQAEQKQMGFAKKLDKLKTQLGEMKKNIATVHEKSKKVGIFKCPTCENKAFKTKEFLQKHIERRHTKKELKEEQKPAQTDQNEGLENQGKTPEQRILKPENSETFKLDEEKIINQISDKINTELGRIQFNLQLEFTEKLKKIEEQSKENTEFLKTNYIPPPPLTEVSGIDKSDLAFNEVMRLNDTLVKTQYTNQMNLEKSREEMRSSITQTQKTLEDYSKKLKKLNKSMRKIQDENKNFQKSFFRSLKAYQQEIKEMEIKREEIDNDEDNKSRKSPFKELKSEERSPSPQKIKEVPKKIVMNFHIGELLSDVDSEENDRGVVHSSHSIDEKESTPIKTRDLENQKLETPIVKEVSPERARKIMEMDLKEKEKMKQLELKEKEFIFLLNNKYREKTKTNFIWTDSSIHYGNKELDLELVDSFIHNAFYEQYEMTFKEVKNKKKKEMMKIWEKCINDNLEVKKDIEEFSHSQNVFSEMKNFLQKNKELKKQLKENKTDESNKKTSKNQEMKKLEGREKNFGRFDNSRNQEEESKNLKSESFGKNLMPPIRHDFPNNFPHNTLDTLSISHDSGEDSSIVNKTKKMEKKKKGTDSPQKSQKQERNEIDEDEEVLENESDEEEKNATSSDFVKTRKKLKKKKKNADSPEKSQKNELEVSDKPQKQNNEMDDLMEKESTEFIQDSIFENKTKKMEKKLKKFADSPQKSQRKEIKEIAEDDEVSENEAEYRKYEEEEKMRKEEEIKKSENLHEFDEASMPSERKPQKINQKDEIDDLMELYENQEEKESPDFNKDSVFKPGISKQQKKEEDSPDKIERFWDGMG